MMTRCPTCGIVFESECTTGPVPHVCGDPVCRESLEWPPWKPDDEQDIYTPDGIYDEYSGKTYV